MCGPRGLFAARAAWLVTAAITALLIAAVVTVSTPAAHASGSTVIGFDNLAAGTTVGDQYLGSGLRLGLAWSFGQSASGGVDCGSPAVGRGTVPAVSAPNYAKLADCSPPGAVARYFAGTYGELVGGASATVSVQVRDLTVGSGTVAMTITGYAANGVTVATGAASATSTGWTALTASTGGAARISYFAIQSSSGVTDVAAEPQIAIDDLAYDLVSAGTTPPSASLSVVTSHPTGGRPVTLSGAGSTPGGSTGTRIISYGWDFNDDGRVDTSTGTNPNATFVFRPGRHTVRLTVTNSDGHSSAGQLIITTAPAPAAPLQPDGGQGPCQSTYTDGSVQILADCIQKLTAGGWVIQTRMLDLNGMMLKPKAGGYGVFKVTPFNELGIGSGTRLSGPAVNVELLNTPIGNMTLGGIDLAANPMQLTFKPFIPATIKLGSAAGDSGAGKTLLASFGVGKQCSGAGKDPSCCPPSGGSSACATLPGNFPLTGQVNVYLNNKGQSLFDVQVELDLNSVGFQATGALEVIADPSTGINLGSLQFTIPQAGLASIFQVKDASFVYHFPSDPDASKRDTWQAKATIVFGPLSQPSLAGELDFKQGQFSYASMLFTAPTGTGVPIYPGILLNQLGASVGVNPLQFGGQLGASIATQLELSLAFKYRDATDSTLGFFGGQGSLSLAGSQIASIAADVYSDGYTDAQVKLQLQYPSTDPVVSASGSIGFWDEPSSGRWEADGSVALKLWVISAEVAGLINDRYIAGCADISGFGVQGRYAFADGSVSGGLFGFSNCSDQLKQYKETPVTQHSGGFVGSIAGVRRAVPAAATTGYQTIHIAGGQSGVELRFATRSGSPVLTLISPSGARFTTPAAPGAVSRVRGRFIAAIAPDTHQLLVLLRHPQGGTWKLVSASGAGRVTSVAQAGEVAPAVVHVHVSHLRRRRYRLGYRIKHYVTGTAIQFVERGHDSTHVLGTAHSARGALTFVPQDALGRRRTVYAYLRTRNGLPLRTVRAGRYRAPAAVRGGAIRRIRFVRGRNSTATLSWSAATGARRYEVVIRGSDGRLVSAFTAPRRRSVTIAEALPSDSYRATVTAQGGLNLLGGRPAHTRLKAIRAARLELLHCSRSTCSGRLVAVATGPLRITTREVHAVLRRRGRIYGIGIARGLRRPSQITLNRRRRFTRGNYTVLLSYRHAGHVHTARETIRLR